MAFLVPSLRVLGALNCLLVHLLVFCACLCMHAIHKFSLATWPRCNNKVGICPMQACHAMDILPLAPPPPTAPQLTMHARAPCAPMQL